MQGNNPTDRYKLDLEHMLQGIRNELNDMVLPIGAGTDIGPEMDDYICHLNRFYYESFHERFMPTYLQYIQQSVNESLGLSRSQSMIKKDIMAIIRRYAGLYNKVKTILHLLWQASKYLESSQLYADRKQELLKVILDSRVEQLICSLRGLNDSLAPALRLLKDQEYITAMASSARCHYAVKTWSMIDPQNPQMMNESVLALDILRLLLQLTSDLSSASTLKEGLDLSEDIKASLARLGSIRNPILRAWLDDSLIPGLSWNITLTNTYLEMERLDQAAQVAQALQQWLVPLVTVLNQKPAVTTRQVGLVQAFSGQDDTVPLLNDLEQRIKQSEKNILQLTKELTAATGDGIKDTLISLQLTLEKDYEYYQSLTRYPALLDSGLGQVCFDLFNIMWTLDYGRFQQETVLHLSGRYQETLHWLKEYSTLFANIGSDLERLLAPRNLTRIWKGMDIRVEHIELRVGSLFPAEYLYLLDKHQVETRLSDTDHKILQAEGDIFIIRVDDLAEEEMPYLVVSMRGQNNASGH
jgi:hypothetical protein